MKKILVLAAALALSASAFAQDVGSVVSAKGNVAVSGGGTTAIAMNGTAVKDGYTVMVPVNGSATVVLKNGCTVSLTERQVLRIDSKATCAQLQASARVPGAPVPGTASTAGVIVGLGVISAAAFSGVKNDEPVSGR